MYDLVSVTGSIWAQQGNITALSGYVKASDFLDSDGNSIIGVSEYITANTETKNIIVGTLDTNDDYCTAV